MLRIIVENIWSVLLWETFFCSLSVCSDGSATRVIHQTIGCDIYYLLGSSSTLSSLMDRSLNVEVCLLFIRGEKLLVQTAM